MLIKNHYTFNQKKLVLLNFLKALVKNEAEMIDENSMHGLL